METPPDWLESAASVVRNWPNANVFAADSEVGSPPMHTCIETNAGGIRPKIATIDFDLGVTYFAYPAERTSRGMIRMSAL